MLLLQRAVIMLLTFKQIITKYVLGESLLSKFMRFLFSGGLAAVANICTLYVLVDFWEIKLFTAVNMAFLFGVIVNFSLQKFFTFQEKREGIYRQFALFALGAAVNIVINNEGVYYLTQVLNIWYIIGQALMLVFLAGLNFLFYIMVVFRNKIYLNDD